jgi:hypothetical protein
MLVVLYPGSFMSFLQILFRAEMTADSVAGALPASMHSTNKSAGDAIRTYCEDLHLPVTKAAARYILRSKTGEELAAAYLHVKRTMHHELSERVFMEPDPRYKGYFREVFLFGEQVFRVFPSANNDIFEAGTCLALERATACVMHLMRVLECGLSALARSLGVSQQTDWGAYLRKIGEELDTRTKIAGKRSDEEQFYAEAAANFDRLRRAWRNPTMHPDKSYSQERAEEILLAVKSFMAHLASRISETASGEQPS